MSSDVRGFTSLFSALIPFLEGLRLFYEIFSSDFDLVVALLFKRKMSK
jgi:hypothetical protein